MKLQIARLGENLLLVDERGTPLPCQRSSVVRSSYNDVGEITVTFVIDRVNVKFADTVPDTAKLA